MKPDLEQKLAALFGPQGEVLNGAQVKVLEVKGIWRKPAVSKITNKIGTEHLGVSSIEELADLGMDRMVGIMTLPTVFLGLVPSVGENQRLGLYEIYWKDQVPTEWKVWEISTWPQEEEKYE